MPAAASIRVLVVDDLHSIRSLVRGCLQQLGFVDFIDAQDGQEGLALMLGPSPAHLVICDFNMPKLDGLGLLAAIRAQPKISKTAFIMLTGRADGELVKKAVKLGVNNYLVKPFTIATLKGKIEAVFGTLT